MLLYDNFALVNELYKKINVIPRPEGATLITE